MDRACTLWKEAANDYHAGYVLPYLMGVCAEIKGDLVSAMEYYRAADQHTMSPVNEINEALARIDKKSKDQTKLVKQLTRNRKPAAKFSKTLARAQKQLVELGYEPGVVDGLMGRKTSLAIRQYQEDNALDLTGKLNTQTKNALGIN